MAIRGKSHARDINRNKQINHGKQRVNNPRGVRLILLVVLLHLPIQAQTAVRHFSRTALGL